MPPTRHEQLNTLGDYLAENQAAILASLRKAADADPGQTTARSLTRGQFEDHLPEMLDAFVRKLRSHPGGREARAADADSAREEVKHGLHRWQQGYRLQELLKEWGHLQLCLFERLAVFAAQTPGFERASLEEANRQLLALVNESICESAAQFERMQRGEAEGRMGDLERALAEINEIAARRATLIHQAVHDLNANVFGVTVAAKLLGRAAIPETDRAEFGELLQRGVQSVTAMLADLTELARLEAGRERREISTFDAAALVAELSAANRPIATGRNLFLELKGPDRLAVDGDPAKVRRLLQNLLRNALNYTERGGVTLSLGDEGDENWWLMIEDTGPGLQSGTNSPIVSGLKEATASARESDEKTSAGTGDDSHVLVPPPRGAPTAGVARHQPGEGIGLSIVKRLCELLDASLEMASSPETGTTFRVVFPRRY